MNGLLRFQERRRFPVIGVAAMVAGACVLLGVNRLGPQSEAWSDWSRWLLGAAGMYLLAWGLLRSLTLLRPQWAAARWPRWNRYRMSVTSEGLAYIGIMSVMFIGSILGRTNMLMLVFAMMIGPWVLNGWIAFSMLRGLQAKRNLPRRVVAGELVSVEIEVRNDKWLIGSWLLVAEDHISHSRDRFEASTLFVRIPARQSRRSQYYVRFSQRGEYRFGPIELRTEFPLGLIERGLRCSDIGMLIVHPQIGRMTARWRSDLWNAAELAERRKMRAGLFDDEFHRMREFRSGDNPRAIHWRTTARRGELMVREFQQTRDRDLVLLVELWQPENPTAADRDRIELAISFAATVLHENLRQSHEARLRMIVLGADTFAWDHLSSLDVALDHLALAAGSSRADVRARMDELVQHVSSGSRVVLVSTRPRDELRSLARYSSDSPDLLCLSAEPRDLAPYFMLEAPA